MLVDGLFLWKQFISHKPQSWAKKTKKKHPMLVMVLLSMLPPLQAVDETNCHLFFQWNTHEHLLNADSQPASQYHIQDIPQSNGILFVFNLNEECCPVFLCHLRLPHSQRRCGLNSIRFCVFSEQARGLFSLYRHDCIALPRTRFLYSMTEKNAFLWYRLKVEVI